jgi:rhamnopyranosyl-N-acetylglucosaminyl-diphospho-decaprenol beta-1,3/1,4-galactofuranosyltransferase
LSESVCTVVVTYNRKELLRRCLGALLTQSRSVDEIIVIDNASSDGTPEMLAAEFPGVIHIRLNANTGGAGGFHEGVKAAYRRGHAWIWVMDDDVYPHVDALGALLQTGQALGRDKNSNILIPVRLWEDGSLADLTALKYDLSTAFHLPSRVRIPVKAVYDQCSRLPECQEVMDFAFEGPLLPREAVEAVGLPSKEYFIYGDDTDYAFRLRRAGFRLILVSCARLFRMIRPDAKTKTPPWKLRYSIRNVLWLSRLYGENWSTRHLRPWLWGIRYIAPAVLKGRMFSDREAFCSIVQGVKEGLFFSPPRCQRGDSGRT